MEIVIDASSGVPPFEQLRSRLAGMVADGTLPAGTRLATVRQLAADLDLAANTVARAYRELEADGVVETHGRRGTFVRSGAMPAPEVDEAARSYVAQARAGGLTCAEAVRLVEGTWAG